MLNDRTTQNGFDNLPGGGADFFCPAQEPIALPVDEKELVERHMLRDGGGIEGLAPQSFMGRDPLVVIEYFHCQLDGPDIHFFSQIFEGDGIEFALIGNETIRLNLGFPHSTCLYGNSGSGNRKSFSSARKDVQRLSLFPVRGAVLTCSRAV